MSSPKALLRCSIVLLAATSATSVRGAQALAGNLEWRFTVQRDQVVSSDITAQNICHKRHRFEIASRELPPFMRLRGESAARVASHARHVFPVAFDANGLSTGEYQGQVVIKCVDCAAEKGCAQDRDVLRIYMTVAPQPAAGLVPNRLVVVIPFSSDAGAQAAAGRLGAAHGMKVEELSRLTSLDAALVVYILPPGSDVLSKAAELAPEVLLAQPDYLYSTLASPSQAAAPPSPLAYGPELIGVNRLRGTVTGKGVKVALIDTGVDAGHPALEGRIVEQADLTGQGFTPDVHATLLAGIIAAGPNNSRGIRGVAPQADILAIKACRPAAPQSMAAQCWSVTLAKAIDLAIEKKAAIINMSLSGPGEVKDRLVERLVDEAVQRGTLVVAAAGNDGAQGKAAFPAALPNVVAVTAVDSKQRLYANATRGDFISLAAPGVEILSTSPGGTYLIASGTSLAAAFVSGTAALALEQQPGLAPKALQSLLEQTATDLGSPGKDAEFGSGLVNACRVVAELRHDDRLCR